MLVNCTYKRMRICPCKKLKNRFYELLGRLILHSNFSQFYKTSFEWNSLIFENS